MKFQNPLSTLPSEINRDILSRLEGKQLFIAQCVSKEWYSFIQDIKLSYTGQPRILILSPGNHEGKHREVRSISPDLGNERLSQFTGHLSFAEPAADECLGFFGDGYRLRVLCSCSGLVLIHIGEHLILWNPHTSWSTKVLELQRLRDDDYKVLGGLCYDLSTSDYKVVLLLSDNTSDHGGHFVLVSTLKSKRWRKMRFLYNYMTSQVGINFNDILHWIVSDIQNSQGWHYYNDQYMKWDNLRCNKIVCFDPVDDTFKTLPSPTQINRGEEDSIVGMGIIDGCFCMATKDEKRQVIQVSIMKEYGKPESWVTSFAISMLGPAQHNFYNLKFVSQNGKVFMKFGYFWRTYVYDVKEDRLEEMFPVPDGVANDGLSCFYVESFDMPHEVSWRDGDEKKCRL
ncbi:unnamed protein product [Cuscuta epithymum]|uniref:F-box domain-containing protein n=1 Tax=Cuscuta epithymum TaxID=186058 RepID=A0AAV0FNR0_9ASTE|nr:unnamed protein product [Cuscuta epithymum]